MIAANEETGPIDKATEDVAAETVSYVPITIVFPNRKNPIQLKLTSLFTIGDIKQLVYDMPDAQFYTCFGLYRKGIPLNESLDIMAIEDIETDPVLELVPELYSEREVRVHLQRFRELLSLFKTPVRSYGLEYGASYFSTVIPNTSTDKPETKKNKKKGASKDQKTELPSETAKTLFGDDSLAESNLDRYIPSQSFLKRQPHIKCIESISWSCWNPVPYHRQLKGDLAYINVVTLEKKTFEIVASAKGFYISQSTEDKFNPLPRTENSCFAHTLPACLALASSGFKPAFSSLQAMVQSYERYEYVLTNTGSYPWCARAEDVSKDDGRVMDYLIQTTETSEQLGARSWNEEYQSAREMPKDVPQDRVVREQNMVKQHYDFVEAATRGAVGIVYQTLPAMNPNEAEPMRMYIHNNIFYSAGYDNREPLNELGGALASHVSVSKDVDGIRIVSQLDQEDISVLGTAVIDYMGRRIVAQNIIPGIMKKANTDSPVKYGTLENPEGDRDIVTDKEFHDSLSEFAKKLRLKEHTVVDKHGQELSFHTTVDVKGIVVADGRRYLLDLYRMTPMDITFLESVDNALKEHKNDDKYSYPHRLCLIRPELLDIYHELKLRQHYNEHKKKLIEEKKKSVEETKENNEEAETKKTEEGKDEEIELTDEEIRSSMPPFSLAFNPDVFTPAYNETDKASEEDENAVRELSQHLNTVSLPSLLLELVNYPANAPYDGEALTAFMHRNGVNMRYLGKFYQMLLTVQAAPLDLVRILCAEEMITRAVKFIIREQIRLLPPLLVPICIAHILNCLYTSPKSKSFEHTRVDEETLSMLSADHEVSFTSLTPKSMHDRLKLLIHQKFRCDLKELENVIKSRSLQILRSICLKLGIQILARDYFTTQPKFTSDDILNMFPIIKSAEPMAMYAEYIREHGRICLIQGQKEMGIELMSEASSLYEQTLGPIHVESGKCFGQSAMIHFQNEEIEKAILDQKRALISVERSSGFDSPLTVQQYINLAYFLNIAGKNSEALSALAHAQKILETLCGDYVHPDMGATYGHIAAIFASMKEFDLSVKYYGKVAKLSESIYGQENQITVSAYDNLTQIHAARADFRSALACCKVVYNYYTKKLGTEHERTIQVSNFLRSLTERAVSDAKKAISGKKPAVTNISKDKNDYPPELEGASVDEVMNYINGGSKSSRKTVKA